MPSPTYELVVDQIRRAIHLGRFLPGDRLPAERQLALQLGVSRTTVREAARVLEGEGLVETRRGSQGGLIVLANELPYEQAREALRADLQAVEEVLDFRQAVEGAAARLAATRRSAEELSRLNDLVAVMESIASDQEKRSQVENATRFRSADSEFHIEVARASHNQMLVTAVEDARAALFLPIGAIFERVTAAANDYHQAVFKALDARDAAGAEEAMEAHIGRTREDLRSFLDEDSRKRYRGSRRQKTSKGAGGSRSRSVQSSG